MWEKLRVISKCITFFSLATASAQLSRPCWETEEFTVQQECFECSDYQKVHIHMSGKDEYRNCRSVSAEELKFWKFEGCRALDRRAENKVRRQIEGI
uniref:Uncharacterized protein n=1 Tax=Erpetoichthys calabaricus TaxID=27687 RepID=A0A8C4RTS9_ERPCA